MPPAPTHGPENALVYRVSGEDAWYFLRHTAFGWSHRQVTRRLEDLRLRARAHTHPFMLFEIDDLDDEDAADASLALVLRRGSCACTFTNLRHLRNTRITASVAGYPEAAYMFQKDCIVVGSAPFDNICLLAEQALPSAFTVTRDGDCFEVHSQDDEDIHVNGERLPYATRVRTAPGEPVVVTGGLRASFTLRIQAFTPPELILEPNEQQ
jgi:hypothetical protein